MSELVTRTGPVPFYRNVAKGLVLFRDVVFNDAKRIMRGEYGTYISSRWHDTGRTLGSLKEKVETDDNGLVKRYLLFPTAVSEKGAPYPLFGEYGTGRLGSSTGRPAPQGYTYGRKQGMAARRYTRLAVQAAIPLIEQANKAQLQRFAQNMTR